MESFNFTYWKTPFQKIPISSILKKPSCKPPTVQFQLPKILKITWMRFLPWKKNPKAASFRKNPAKILSSPLEEWKGVGGAMRVQEEKAGLGKRNRGRVADTPILIAIYARLVVVVGVRATKGHAPRAAVVALKRFAEEESHRGSRIAGLLLLALSLAPVAFQRRKRFTCLSTRIGFTRPAFVGIGAAIRVPAAIDGCETRTRSCSRPSTHPA